MYYKYAYKGFILLRFNPDLLCFFILSLCCFVENANFPGTKSRLLIGCLVTNQKARNRAGEGVGVAIYARDGRHFSNVL